MNAEPRPELYLCLATTLDGKISEATGQAPNFTSRFDRQKLFRLRAEADVLLVGANTVRQELLAPLVRDPELVAQRRQAGKPDHPAVAIVSRSLQLPWQHDYFKKPQQALYIITEGFENGPPSAAKELEIEWIQSESPNPLKRGITQLAQLGHPKILAEGGGTLVHSLLKQDLVDRLYLTIAPTILGGRESPSLCSGPILDPRSQFVLVDCARHQDELHLEYRMPSKAAQPSP